MDSVIAFLKDNADWMFGGGGIAAVLLATTKLFGGKKDEQAGVSISGGRVEGGVAGRDNITNVDRRNGVSGRDVALILAVVITLLGAVFQFLPVGTQVTATNGSAAVVGDDNTTTVINGGE